MKKIGFIVSLVLLALLIIAGFAYGIAAKVNKEDEMIVSLQKQLLEINSQIQQNKEVYERCQADMQSANQANNELRQKRNELIRQVSDQLGLEDVGLIQE